MARGIALATQRRTYQHKHGEAAADAGSSSGQGHFTSRPAFVFLTNVCLWMVVNVCEKMEEERPGNMMALR